jgi:hypothetical protein
LANGLYNRALTVYDDLHERWRKARHDRLTLDHIAAQNSLHKVREIRADERGRYPILYGENGILRDPNNLRAFTLSTVLERWPELEHLDAMHRQLCAMAGLSAPTQALEQITRGTAPIINLDKTTLDHLMVKHSFRPRLHEVLIGETLDPETGTIRPLTLDLPKSVHVLCTGGSGLGKSTLLEAIALQLVGLDGVAMAAVDYGSGTFDGLEGYMRWPVVDTPNLAIALFHELLNEIGNRKAMYREADRVRSLDQFNAMTGADLPFLAVFVDETSALLEYEGTKDRLIELCRTGRKFGIGLVLGGTDFKCTTLPSEARGNCLARIAFWLESGLSRSLLDTDAATELQDVGEIVVKRPGHVGTVKGRTPLVTGASYARLPQTRGEHAPLASVPEIIKSTDKEQRIRDLAEQGLSTSAIAHEVYGYSNGRTVRQVQDVLDRHDDDDTNTPTGAKCDTLSCRRDGGQ